MQSSSQKEQTYEDHRVWVGYGLGDGGAAGPAARGDRRGHLGRPRGRRLGRQVSGRRSADNGASGLSRPVAPSDHGRRISLPGSDFVIIATPTNYDTELDFFDTSSVEGVIAQVAERAPSSTIVIKSTIPVGFTNRMREEHPTLTILFSPEFLREGVP